jgi:hypothetical protein
MLLRHNSFLWSQTPIDMPFNLDFSVEFDPEYISFDRFIGSGVDHFESSTGPIGELSTSFISEWLTVVTIHNAGLAQVIK